MDTKAAAEAIVADLYMHHGIGADPQFKAEAYRRRLVVSFACILDALDGDSCERIAELEKAERELALYRDYVSQWGEEDLLEAHREWFEQQRGPADRHSAGSGEEQVP